MSARTRTSSARALTPAPDRPALAADILGYPDQLPVVAAREEILAAIRKHQVVVIAGETGSGKTTQLPKMCLELGLGSAGAIGHTQPRRIAARSVAELIAEELGSGRLPGALHRLLERAHPGQGDDRRHPAQRIAARP